MRAQQPACSGAREARPSPAQTAAPGPRWAGSGFGKEPALCRHWRPFGEEASAQICGPRRWCRRARARTAACGSVPLDGEQRQPSREGGTGREPRHRRGAVPSGGQRLWVQPERDVKARHKAARQKRRARVSASTPPSPCCTNTRLTPLARQAGRLLGCRRWWQPSGGSSQKAHARLRLRARCRVGQRSGLLTPAAPPRPAPRARPRPPASSGTARTHRPHSSASS